MYVNSLKNVPGEVVEGVSTISLDSLLQRTEAKNHDLVLGPKPTLSDLLRAKVEVLDKILSQHGSSREGMVLRFTPGGVLDELGKVIATKQKELELMQNTSQEDPTVLCSEFIEGTCTADGCLQSHSLSDLASWCNDMVQQELSETPGLVNIRNPLHIEAFTGVLKKVATTEVSKLHVRHSEKQATRVLFKMLSSYELQNVTQLNLTGNLLGETDISGVAKLASSIRNCPTLKSLILNSMGLRDKGALTVVASFDPQFICNGVTCLELQDNGITPGARFDEMLKIIGKSLNLTNISFSCNPLQKAVGGLGDVLKTSGTLATLRLSNTGITDKGLSLLTDGVQSCHTLTSLDISDNTGLSPEALHILFSVLSDNQTLAVLNLSGVALNHPLSSPSPNPVRLADFLKANTALLSLDLERVPVPDVTLQSISEGLQCNTSLRTLNMTEHLCEKRLFERVQERLRRRATEVSS